MRRTLVAIIIVSLLCASTIPSAAHASAPAADLGERPSAHLDIDRKASEGLQNSTTDGKATVGLGINVHDYDENQGGFPAEGSDVIRLKFSTLANTREIITYGVQTVDYSWHELDELSHTISWAANDYGQSIYLDGYVARFFGGPNSAEYNSVWLCSNGFISFMTDATDKDYSFSIPNTEGPNGFIAPFWRDLRLDWGGSIKYGRVQHSPTGTPPYVDCFCISWSDVPDIHNVHQSFQVLIENAPTLSGKLRQSRIWFQYKSVTLNDQTTVGIEDQRGGKGVSYNYQLLQNGVALRFEQNSNSALIGGLKIILTENEANARTKIVMTEGSWRGTNIVLENDVQDPYATYAPALEGGLTLLQYAVDLKYGATYGTLIPTAGFLIGGFFVVLEYAEDAARRQAESVRPVTDPDDSTFAGVSARVDPDRLFISSAVDASFDISAWWILEDHNTAPHDLTVTAELTYYEYDYYGTLVSTTTRSASVPMTMGTEPLDKQVTLPVIIGGSVNVDDREDGFWYVLYGYNFRTVITVTPDARVDLKLQLWNNIGYWDLIETKDDGGVGYTETIIENFGGAYNIHRLVRVIYKDVQDNPSYRYNLHIYTEPWYGGGGGGGGGPPPKTIPY